MLTSKFIELIKGEETLRKNAIIESRSKKHPLLRAKALKEIFLSLVDDGSSSWFGTELSKITLDSVSWQRVDSAFRHMEI